MSEFHEKYADLFPDFGVNGEPNEDSLKYYRDLKNSLDTAKEEGFLEGKIQGEIQGEIRGEIRGKIQGEIQGEIKKAHAVVITGHREGLSIPMLAKLTGLTEEEVLAIIQQEHGDV